MQKCACAKIKHEAPAERPIKTGQHDPLLCRRMSQNGTLCRISRKVGSRMDVRKFSVPEIILGRGSLKYAALCAKRLRPADVDTYDLSNWRAACVGAERINPEPLEEFARILKPCGFDEKAFVACYGMAECVLATSFAPLGAGLNVDVVDRKLMAETGAAQPSDGDEKSVSAYVDCGKLLPGFQFRILDDAGNELGNRQCGHIHLKGPAVMRHMSVTGG